MRLRAIIVCLLAAACGGSPKHAAVSPTSADPTTKPADSAPAPEATPAAAPAAAAPEPMAAPAAAARASDDDEDDKAAKGGGAKAAPAKAKSKTRGPAKKSKTGDPDEGGQ
jgi:pyruvate/2-oxoglutarate dehydrogenase complex dihydrolipoamide acyltransferase (E2) component